MERVKMFRDLACLIGGGTHKDAMCFNLVMKGCRVVGYTALAFELTSVEWRLE